MMTQMQVHLYRDSFTTPWGIRLQGGKDLTSPLVVQRVFPNTPAAGYLQRGDILLTLNGKDAGGLTHKQAQDVFQFAGGQIPLTIRRPNIEGRNPPPAKPQQHQTYRTVPLDLEGPTKMAHPHVPKGGMKYGGGGPSYGVSYTPPGGVQRQSSKPWEDNEMLHKVQDTLAHKSYQQVSSYNGGPPVHYQHVAPPAYVPGPPPSSDTSYIDPFPSYVPPKPSEEDDDDYEFLPVSQRRNQFNKEDYVQDVRKPTRTRGRPQTFRAPPPPPHLAPKPVVQPVYAPMSRPAEGEVVRDETPAWSGTLSSASGAKLWDAGFQPSHHVSPTRSVSPSKRSGKKPPAPRPTQEFAPTKTQALDFSNDPEDGPRIMHLQYNSPLDMYSRENVQETLQGQTQAALGGGNTASTTTTTSDTQDTDNVAVSETVIRLGKLPTQHDHPPAVPPKPVRHKVAAATEASIQDTQIHSVTPPPSAHPETPPAPRPVTPTPLRQVTPPPSHEATPPREATPTQSEQPMSRSARRRLAAQAQREALAAAQADAEAQAQAEVQAEAQWIAEPAVEPAVEPPTTSPPSFSPPPPVMLKPSRPAPPPAPMRDLTSQPGPLKKKEEEEEELTLNLFRVAIFACLCAIILYMVFTNGGIFASIFRRKVVESQLAVEEGSVDGNAGPETAPGKDIADES